MSTSDRSHAGQERSAYCRPAGAGRRTASCDKTRSWDVAPTVWSCHPDAPIGLRHGPNGPGSQRADAVKGCCWLLVSTGPLIYHPQTEGGPFGGRPRAAWGPK
jgi:hypothetical protein